MTRAMLICIFVILVIVTEVTYTRLIIFNETEEIDINFNNTQYNQSDYEMPINKFDITKLYATPTKGYMIMRLMFYTALGIIFIVFCVQACQLLEGMPRPPIRRLYHRYIMRLYIFIVDVLQYRPVRAIEDIELE